MASVKIANKNIEVKADIDANNEEEILEDLNLAICSIIAIYKYRIERIKCCKLSCIDEIVINQKIRDAIVMIPVDDIRDSIKEMIKC